MSDLILDLDALNKLKAELISVSNTFRSAQYLNKGIVDAIGHDGHAHTLQGKVSDFAGKWDIRRNKILEAMDTIVQTVNAIHNTFAEVDKELANALTAAPEKSA